MMMTPAKTEEDEDYQEIIDIDPAGEYGGDEDE